MHKIGSEFYNNSVVRSNYCKRKVRFDGNQQGFLCGRTALEYIIRDAQSSIGFESILLPSYCCYSIIEPFVKNGVKIGFYSVVLGENGFRCILPEGKENEALYLIPYFGFFQPDFYNVDDLKKWKFCILDETHSCFSMYKWNYDEWNIKYTYSSYRKWADIKGFAVARKLKDNFQIEYPQKVNFEYVQKKSDACFYKQRYVENNIGEEIEFLQLYSEAEEILERDYTNYRASEIGVLEYEVLDIDTLREKRRKNGNYLLENLRNMRGVSLIYRDIQEQDCPLFIPILVKNGMRNQLRRYLTERSIYCPIHWPISELHNLKNEQEYELYEQELSIVCDQRYGIDDMKRIIDVMQEFLDN